MIIEFIPTERGINMNFWMKSFIAFLAPVVVAIMYFSSQHDIITALILIASLVCAWFQGYSSSKIDSGQIVIEDLSLNNDSLMFDWLSKYWEDIPLEKGIKSDMMSGMTLREAIAHRMGIEKGYIEETNCCCDSDQCCEDSCNDGDSENECCGGSCGCKEKKA